MFWLVDKRRVVEFQSFHRIAQTRKCVTFLRKHAGVHHGTYFFISRKRGRVFLTTTDRVSYATASNFFHARDDIADLPGLKCLASHTTARCHRTNFKHGVFFFRHGHAHRLIFLDCSIHNTHIGHHATIVIIKRIKHKRACFCRWISGWGWNAFHNRFQKRINSFSRFSTDSQNRIRVTSEQLHQFRFASWNICRRQIDLVEHRNNFQILTKRQK